MDTSIKERLRNFWTELPSQTALVAVSKNQTVKSILEAYEAGQRDFGENKVQELTRKISVLPPDIRWHFIGHLQTNKVKFIIPGIHLIQSVDSLKLLNEINHESGKKNHIQNILLQIYIASEDTKFGFSPIELDPIMARYQEGQFTNIRILGFMGMASNTSDETIIRKEFRELSALHRKFSQTNKDITHLSMGMSNDYKIGVQEGSTYVRIGTAIFGERQLL